MVMSKKVSVIVCTYNARDELKECLESLGNLDYTDKEIIIVNDASSDGTLEFLQQFRNETSLKAIIVTNEINRGVAGSRNIGIQHASGEIIAFTDSDCVADRRWISELVKIYDIEDVAAVGGKILDTRVTSIWNLAGKGLNFVASSEGYVPYIQGCNMSFDGGLLRKYMFNDEIKYGYEETLLCDYLVDAGYKIYYNPGAVVHHKHRTNLAAILKQKYLRGLSSIWYRKKKNKLFMFKRHLVLLISLLCIPLFVITKFFLYISLILFLVFLSSLLRDEIIFHHNINKNMIISFPFLILIELFHFAGSCAGVVKFRFHKEAGK
jgi:glycosyltransferase involved in cell wall biosynthesis